MRRGSNIPSSDSVDGHGNGAGGVELTHCNQVILIANHLPYLYLIGGPMQSAIQGAICFGRTNVENAFCARRNLLVRQIPCRIRLMSPVRIRRQEPEGKALLGKSLSDTAFQPGVIVAVQVQVRLAAPRAVLDRDRRRPVWVDGLDQFRPQVVQAHPGCAHGVDQHRDQPRLHRRTLPQCPVAQAIWGVNILDGRHTRAGDPHDRQIIALGQSQGCVIR